MFIAISFQTNLYIFSNILLLSCFSRGKVRCPLVHVQSRITYGLQSSGYLLEFRLIWSIWIHGLLKIRLLSTTFVWALISFKACKLSFRSVDIFLIDQSLQLCSWMTQLRLNCLTQLRWWVLPKYVFLEDTPASISFFIQWFMMALWFLQVTSRRVLPRPSEIMLVINSCVPSWHSLHHFGAYWIIGLHLRRINFTPIALRGYLELDRGRMLLGICTSPCSNHH